MSIIPVPDELTHYSSRRLDEVDELAWPVLSQHVLDLLRSSGEELHPAPGELLWDAGDPSRSAFTEPERRTASRSSRCSSRGLAGLLDPELGARAVRLVL